MGVISIVNGNYNPTYNWGGTTLQHILIQIKLGLAKKYSLVVCCNWEYLLTSWLFFGRVSKIGNDIAALIIDRILIALT